MVIFNVGEEKRHDLRAHFEVAERVSKEISATFKAPNDLEFEKCSWHIALFEASFPPFTLVPATMLQRTTPTCCSARSGTQVRAGIIFWGDSTL